MDFLTNFHPTTTTGLHLTVNYYCERSKANFDRLLAAALTTKKINCPKYQSGNINKIVPSALASASCKISRQKRRCRSKPPRQSDVRDDKNVCCLSSLLIDCHCLLRHFLSHLNRNCYHLYPQFLQENYKSSFFSSES